MAPKQPKYKKLAAKAKAAGAPPSQRLNLALRPGRLRGGMAKIDFMHDAAAKAALPAASVQKLLGGLKTTVIDQLREKGYCCIGGICRLTVKIKPPQEARTLVRWGKEIRVKARVQPFKKITCVMLRPISHALE